MLLTIAGPILGDHSGGWGCPSSEVARLNGCCELDWARKRTGKRGGNIKVGEDHIDVGGVDREILRQGGSSRETECVLWLSVDTGSKAVNGEPVGR